MTGGDRHRRLATPRAPWASSRKAHRRGVDATVAFGAPDAASAASSGSTVKACANKKTDALRILIGIQVRPDRLVRAGVVGAVPAFALAEGGRAARRALPGPGRRGRRARRRPTARCDRSPPGVRANGPRHGPLRPSARWRMASVWRPSRCRFTPLVSSRAHQTPDECWPGVARTDVRRAQNDGVGGSSPPSACSGSPMDRGRAGGSGRRCSRRCGVPFVHPGQRLYLDDTPSARVMESIPRAVSAALDF
jgi:hypothetical protein